MGRFLIAMLARRRQEFPGAKRGVAVAGGDGERGEVLHPSGTDSIPNGPCPTSTGRVWSLHDGRASFCWQGQLQELMKRGELVTACFYSPNVRAPEAYSGI